MGTIDRELGQKNLMLRIPQFRNELRNASGSKIDELFVAYQLTVSVHDRALVEPEAPREWIEHYVRIFRDIEEEIAEFFSRVGIHHGPCVEGTLIVASAPALTLGKQTLTLGVLLRA